MKCRYVAQPFQIAFTIVFIWKLLYLNFVSTRIIEAGQIKQTVEVNV